MTDLTYSGYVVTGAFGAFGTMLVQKYVSTRGGETFSYGATNQEKAKALAVNMVTGGIAAALFASFVNDVDYSTYWKPFLVGFAGDMILTPLMMYAYGMLTNMRGAATM